MTVPFWTVVVASLLPIFTAFLGGYYRGKQFGEFDNKYPRLQAAGMTGIGARVLAAQQNSWEALAIFAPAVIISHLAGVTGQAASIACLVFIAARLLYIAAYIGNWDKLRSLVFIVGLGASLSLYIMAA